METERLLRENTRKSDYRLSVEPALLFFRTAAVMSGAVFQNFLLFRTCDRYNQKESKCETELDSEEKVTALVSLETFSLYVLWILSVSCAGSLVDRNIKYLRWFLFFPAAGQVICDALNVMNAAYFEWSPFLAIVYTSLILGLSGSYVGALLMSTTYVSHQSTSENRAIRIGYVVFAQIIGQGLGDVTGGYVIKYLGFTLGFSLCIVLNVFSLVLGYIFIKDLSDCGPADRAENLPTKNYFVAFVEGLTLLLKKRSHKRRTMLVLLLVIYILNHCYRTGENIYLYLFLRNEYNWDAAQYGVLMLYATCTKTAGTLFATEILKRRLHLPDAAIGLLAAVFEFISHTLWFVLPVVQSWKIYTITTIGMFERVIELIAMSLASNIVEPREYGRLSSLFALSRFFIPLATLLYSFVYQRTLRDHPLMIFAIGIWFCIAMALAFGILYLYTRLSGSTAEMPDVKSTTSTS